MLKFETNVILTQYTLASPVFYLHTQVSCTRNTFEALICPLFVAAAVAVVGTIGSLAFLSRLVSSRTRGALSTGRPDFHALLLTQVPLLWVIG